MHMEIFIRTLAMKSKLLAYLRLPWVFPRSHKVRAYDAASVAVNKEKFGCTASEGLTILHLYPGFAQRDWTRCQRIFFGGEGAKSFSFFTETRNVYQSPRTIICAVGFGRKP